MTLRLGILRCLLGLALTFVGCSFAYATEVVDGRGARPTQRNFMHACPVGWFVVGVHVDNNELLCSNMFGSYPSREIVDGDNEPVTVRSQMHACPRNMGMTGLHATNNWLSCAPITGGISSERLDGPPPTQRNNMHACPVGYVLTGIHVGNNQFLCGAPPSPSPFIDLSLSNANIAVVWGNTVSLTVTVKGKNGFAGAVNLTLENVPFGVTPSFAPAIVNIPQNGTATSTLNLHTVAAGTKLVPPALRIRAAPQAGGVASKTANFTLDVRRTPGRFDPVALRTTPSSCGSGSVTAIVVPTGNGPGVQFIGVPFNQTEIIQFSTGYAFSPRCRIGLVIPPVLQNLHRTKLWNLGFNPAIGGTGAAALGSFIYSASGVFTNGYFSQDDSLFLLITPTGGVGTREVAGAVLYDLARGTTISGGGFFTATVISVVLNGNTVTLNTNPPFSINWTVP